MSLPKTVRDFALKHKISVGRNNYGYYIREHGLVVEQTRSAKPTVANALAMMRRHLRAHRKEGSYPAKNPVPKNTYFSVETYHGGRPVRSEADNVAEAHAIAKGSPTSVISALREGWLIRDFHFSPKHPLPGVAELEREIIAALKRYDARKPIGENPVKKKRRVRRVRRAKRNPMSAQARKDFARRMARARAEKQARKRIAIKRQIRRSGGQVDANANTKLLRAQRKASAPRGMYQIGALTADKRIAWWGGSGFTLLRGDAVGYGSLAQARVKAKRLEPNLVAGIFRSDVSAERARNFLLGKK